MRTLEGLVRRDRALSGVALLVLTAVAWVALLRMRADMTSMAGGGMAGMQAGTSMSGMSGRMHEWSAFEPAMLFLMWSTMMVAMMLPSAAPMILLVASVERRRRERASPAASTAIFAAGYLVVWVAFSAAAALTQWGLHLAALLSPEMASTSPVLGGALLATAGVYQWMPAKSACLSHCRSPLTFLGSEWREGSTGALVMGVKHGFYCLGCCWALMLLLFVAGVMNLLWVVAIAALVLVEKLARGGPWIGRLAGIVLVACGGWLALFQ